MELLELEGEQVRLVVLLLLLFPETEGAAHMDMDVALDFERESEALCEMH